MPVLPSCTVCTDCVHPCTDCGAEKLRLFEFHSFKSSLLGKTKAWDREMEMVRFNDSISRETLRGTSPNSMMCTLYSHA